MKITEDIEAFSEVNIDMTIQSQVLSMHAIKSIQYVTMHEWKTPKIQKVEGFMYMRTTRENFAYSSSFAKVFAPVKSIIPWSY